MIQTAELEPRLIERGVNPRLARGFVRDLSPQTISDTLDWFDAQHGRVDAGVLVIELRQGGRAPTPASLQERQVQYGEQIVAWLREHFPQWNREQGNRTHTAAIACVIRLHHKHGKGRLSVREHGAEIRAAVDRWEEEYGALEESGA